MTDLKHHRLHPLLLISLRRNELLPQCLPILLPQRRFRLPMRHPQNNWP
jgi:hypothetical protein